MKIEELSKATEAAKRMSAFDGTWIVTETCTSAPPFPAATLQYAVQIKDGTLHTSFGDEGKPGRVTFDGKIGADGAATIAVDGLTDPAKDPVHRPPGTPFHYALTLQFKESVGVGARTQTPRPYHVEVSKLPATALPPSDVDESSKGKGTESAVAPPPSSHRISATMQGGKVSQPAVESVAPSCVAAVPWFASPTLVAPIARRPYACVSSRNA